MADSVKVKNDKHKSHHHHHHDQHHHGNKKKKTQNKSHANMHKDRHQLQSDYNDRFTNTQKSLADISLKEDLHRDVDNAVNKREGPLNSSQSAHLIVQKDNHLKKEKKPTS